MDHPLTRDVVLVGGGHAHALVLRRWGMDPLPGARLWLVSPGAVAPYTGMLPGHVAGHFTREELEIDLVALCRYAGAAFVDGRVTRVGDGVLEVEGRAPLPFDVASLDVGIHGRLDLPGFAEHGLPAKPLDAFAEAWRGHVARGGDVAVIGAGVAGVELSLAMAHALGGRGRVTLIGRAPGLTGVSARAGAKLRAALDAQGVATRLGTEVARVDADRVVLGDGSEVPAVVTVGAAGAMPYGWLAASGLPVQDGFVRVGPTLQVEGRPDLFAVGDCAHLSHAPRDKAGVYAVREAPFLHHNLRAALTGGRMRRYDPQRSYLKLIQLGGKTALGEKAGMTLGSPALWRLKDGIDARFMGRLRDLPPMQAARPKEVALGAEDVAKPLCGGCGAKVGGGALARALSALPLPARDDVLSRPGDDAAVLRVGGARQVLTTDHLRAVTGDDALMARIAAVHAMGDVWAMGARPQAALVSLVLPRQTDAMAERVLARMMGALAEVLGEAGAEVVGGHTTMGAEMVVGVTLTGLLDGDPVGLAGARAGDALVLSKAIGTGAVLAAAMAGRAAGRDVVGCLAAMAAPQGDAAALLAPAARAMTDVTGFGLAGHLAGICRASGVGAEVALAAVPVLPGAAEAAEAGVASSLHASNAADAPVAGAAGPVGSLLHDPQTSGGLLAVVPEGEAARLVEALRGMGHAGAAVIGRVVEGAGVRAV